MASVTVTGSLLTASGKLIPLRVDSHTEGTSEASLTTDSNSPYGTVAQNIGDYAPGETIVSASPIQANSATGSCNYAYVLRQGVIASILPVSSPPGTTFGTVPLAKPLRLQPGDTVRFACNLIAARLVAWSLYTTDGTCRIFTGTAASGTVEMTDLQTGNGIGDTLQGKTVIGGWASISGTVAQIAAVTSPGGIVIQDASGLNVGMQQVTDVARAQLQPMNVKSPCAIKLNWVAKITSSA